MMARISRGLMALAVCALGDHRREWALAMQAEFQAASDDGKSLRFAIGCLMAVCRDLPTHEEGRFAVSSHVFALAVLVPLAALMISSILIGFPASYLERVVLPDLFGMGSEQTPLLSDGNKSAVPAFAMLVLLLAALKLRMAWLALDRDYARLIKVGLLSAAATATLVIFSTVVFVHPLAACAQIALLAAELIAAWSLAQWHSRLSSSSSAALC
jgi:hypothetical protein